MKIEYVHKMGNDNKPFAIFKKEEVSENIMDIILTDDNFKKSTVFGQKGLGDPEEIEKLVITFDDGTKKSFEYYNKGIYYMIFGREKDRPVFQVFAHFMVKK